MEVARILRGSVFGVMTLVSLLSFAAGADAISIDQVVSPTKSTSQTVTGAMDPGAVVSVQCDGAVAGVVSYPTESSWSVLITGLKEGSNDVIASSDIGSPASATAVIVVDTTAPMLTVSTLADGAFTNNQTLNVAGVATDGANGAPGVSVNGTVVTLAADGSFSYPLTLSTGANSVITIATDTAGNSAEDKRTVTLDQAAPQITIDSPADNIATSQSPMAVTGTVDENSLVEFSVNGGSPQAALMSGTSFTADVSLAQGINTITITATDRAANTSTAKRTVTYDTTKPALQIQDPSQDIVTNQSGYTVKGTVSDTLSTVTVTVAVDGVTSTPPVNSGAFEQPVSFDANRTYQITATATDAAGNATSVVRNIIYDNIPPTITGASSTTAAGHYGTGRSINVTLAFSEPVFSPGLTISLSSQATITTGALSGADSFSGTYVVAAGHNTALLDVVAVSGTLADAAGNQNAAPAIPAGHNIGNAVTISIDTTAPIATIGSHPADPTNSKTGSFSFSIDEPGTIECRMDDNDYGSCTSPRSFDFSALADSSHTFSVRGTDLAGNVGAAHSFSWTIDTVAPDTTITTQPNNPTNQTGAAFSFVSSKPAGASFECALDGGANPAFASCVSPQSYSALTPGDHTFSVRALDAAGNSDATPATFSWNIDTQAPSVSLTGQPGTPSNSKTGAFSFTSPDTTASFECRYDGDAYGSCTSPSHYDFSGSADGQHSFSVRPADPAGNVGTPASYAWLIDTTPPQVNAGQSQIRNASFSQTGTVSDATALTYQWTQQSGPGSITFGAPAARETAISANADGIYLLRLTATDAAGNTASGDMTLTWDTTAPTIDAGGDRTANAQFTQTGKVSDATALTYQWTQQSGPGKIAFGSPTALATTVATETDGTYVLRLTATDAAGNSSSGDMKLTWDTVRPTVDAGASTAHNAAYTQAGSASDPLGMTFSWSYTPGPGTTGTIVFDSPAALSTRVTADKEGVYRLVLTATDAAGNMASSEAATLTWDLTRPVVSLPALPGAKTFYTSDAVLTIKGGTVTDALSGVQSFTINGEAITLDANGAIIAPDGIPLTAGPQVISLSATDFAGNTYSDVRTVIYDPDAPKITINSPSNSDYKTNLSGVTITGMIDKECSVAIHVSGGGLEQSFSNVPVSYLPGSDNNYAFTLPIEGLALGPNTIEVTATSNANQQSTKSITVTYDNQKPLLDVTSPAGDVRAGQGGIVISGTTSDLQTGVTITITKDLETYQPQVVNGSFSQAIPLTDKGMYTIAVKASDGAGNETIVKRRVINGTPTGDVDGDGYVTIADALLALQVSVGLKQQLDSYLVEGDIGPQKNGVPAPDWKIDISDVVLILRKAAKLSL